MDYDKIRKGLEKLINLEAESFMEKFSDKIQEFGDFEDIRLEIIDLYMDHKDELLLDLRKEKNEELKDLLTRFNIRKRYGDFFVEASLVLSDEGFDKDFIKFSVTQYMVFGNEKEIVELEQRNNRAKVFG